MNKDKTTELLNCPFCGGEAEWSYSTSAYGAITKHPYLSCSVCEASTVHFDEGEEGKAIKAWNNRAEPVNMQLLEALKEADIIGAIDYENPPSFGELLECVAKLQQVIANAQAQGVDGWMDIESAPKDGAEILWCGGSAMAVIKWPEYSLCWIGSGNYWQPLPQPPKGAKA